MDLSFPLTMGSVCHRGLAGLTHHMFPEGYTSPPVVVGVCGLTQIIVVHFVVALIERRRKISDGTSHLKQIVNFLLIARSDLCEGQSVAFIDFPDIILLYVNIKGIGYLLAGGKS